MQGFDTSGIELGNELLAFIKSLVDSGDFETLNNLDLLDLIGQINSGAGSIIDLATNPSQAPDITTAQIRAMFGLSQTPPNVLTPYKMSGFLPIIDGTNGDDLFIPGEISGYAFGFGGNDTFDLRLTPLFAAVGGAGSDRYIIGEGSSSSPSGGTLLDFDLSDIIDLSSTSITSFSELEITVYDLATSGVSGSTAQITTADGKIFISAAGVQDLNGLTAANFVFGGAIAPTITSIDGSAGNDTVTGTFGDDTVRGLGGDDVVDGGEGDDFVNGNAGNDTVTGGIGDDRVLGGKGEDIVYGESGDDTLNGNLGNDTVHGGVGGDDVRGGKGDDVLYGESFNDTLRGNLGDDTLIGGTGSDVFYFSAGAGNDTINDFVINEDTIQFTEHLFTTLAGVIVATSYENGNAVITYSNDEKLTILNVEENGSIFSAIEIISF